MTGEFLYGGGVWWLTGAVGVVFDSEPAGIFNLDIRGQALLSSTGQSQRYWSDSNDDGPTANHIWYQDGLDAGDRMMQLQHTNGGDLLIAGDLTTMQMFDIAESFWEQQSVTAGQLVAVDPARPDAVRPTTRAYERELLGVASDRPAIVLGGGAFSPDALERTWGREIAAAFERQRPLLEAEAFATSPELVAEARRVETREGFAAYLESQRSPPPGSALRSPGPPSPDSVDAAWARARSFHEANLFDATAERFFAERFARVALAGRVPVRVDASFGAIAPGDPITSSPVAGTAMKATEAGPVVGVALEALETGTGLIQVLVHRSWYGGEGRSVAGREGRAAAAAEGSEKGTIRELEQRLALLEERLRRLDGHEDARGPAISRR